MNFSFGITTDYSNKDRIEEIIKSIENLKIPNYEIILIGNEIIENRENVTFIFFDESIKSSWITRKKNL